jgi:hypothetical protein
LQARRINALFGEKFRALLDRFENCHATLGNNNYGLWLLIEL